MAYYKLLTPDPLTTTDTVKNQMLFDHCTWDDDYKIITQSIRQKLLNLAHVSEQEYTTVLMQGSGTFGVESVLTSVIGAADNLLIVANGAYGERMEDIAAHEKFRTIFTMKLITRCPAEKRLGRFLKNIRKLPMLPWFIARRLPVF